MKSIVPGIGCRCSAPGFGSAWSECAPEQAVFIHIDYKYGNSLNANLPIWKGLVLRYVCLVLFNYWIERSVKRAEGLMFKIVSLLSLNTKFQFIFDYFMC